MITGIANKEKRHIRHPHKHGGARTTSKQGIFFHKVNDF